MKLRMKHGLLLAAVLAATPAAAQEAEPAVPPSAGQPPIPVDPTRAATARAVVDHVFPAGSYARLMDKSLAAMTGAMADNMGKLLHRDLARIGGLSDDEAAQLDEATLKQMAQIIDPVFDERAKLILTAMGEQTASMMTRFEPGMRAGLAEAYARRFTADQLADLDRFFKTPTGAIYASESMMLFLDPEVVQRMQAAMPEIMQEMPKIMASIQTRVADLPRLKTYADLTPAERGQLAKLIGISEAELARRQQGKR